ncbi:hypothetical protein K503DRAFT_806517 [Rhizopogon vinicolor AM-OR11-026]|uniref:Uncharacterized protein n=1 Tax=Rhizopogon vinicolor AM-OR11-026 TaxID=1314800 RepID=A0A1B7MED4_9AGAM|nr:hypothetical protein K503DRAFT_806517 [Rhizopogon vinicolor AM-OR11-026]
MAILSGVQLVQFWHCTGGEGGRLEFPCEECQVGPGDEGLCVGDLPAAAPFEVYVDGEVADEMDEYGYSGLDQVVNEGDENEEMKDDENVHRQTALMSDKHNFAAAGSQTIDWLRVFDSHHLTVRDISDLAEP